VQAGAENREERDGREQSRGPGLRPKGGEEEDAGRRERDSPGRPLERKVCRENRQGEEEGRADEPQNEPEGFPRRVDVGGQTRTSSWSGA